jgi:hypothetical protein
MISKEQVQSLIKQIKEATGLRQGQISIEAGYKEKTLTELVSKGEKLESVYTQLRLVFKDRLKKSTTEEAPPRFTADQLFQMFLEVSKAQTAILTSIESKMARETTQANMDRKINKLDDRLNEALAGIETIVDLGDEILQKFPAAPSIEEPEKKRPLRDADKKLDESVAGVHKRGKHNGGRR